MSGCYWLLLAGTDLVAVDATAARVMSHHVADMVQLNLASDMGLGEIAESKIEIIGDKLENLIVPWESSSLSNSSNKCCSIYSV